MDKKEIQHKLIDTHNLFTEFVFGLSEAEFLNNNNNKWSAGQQAEHIYLSIKPLRQALSFPKVFLSIIWGKANRTSKSYDELVEKYKLKLKNGGQATGRFIPITVSVEKGKKIQAALLAEVRELCSKLEKFTEKELDEYILPHPLLGKLTLREMLFFTIYHAAHHQNLTKQNLSV